MRQDALARRNEPDAQPTSVSSAEAPMPKADYEALCAALGATARGRAFLDEHARRARRKDTALALQALSRLEEELRKRDTTSEATARFRGELCALHSAVVSARTNFIRFEGMLAKRETVMALFDMLELRITEMLAEVPGDAEPLAANENELLAAAETQATLVAVHAALVTEEPEPSPAPRRDVLIEPAVKQDSPKPIAKLESQPSKPADPTPAPRPRGEEAEKQIVQAVAAPALSAPESFPDEIFAPARHDRSE